MKNVFKEHAMIPEKISYSDKFVQEYLYIEDEYYIPPKSKLTESEQFDEEEINRGVIIIDLF